MNLNPLNVFAGWLNDMAFPVSLEEAREADRIGWDQYAEGRLRSEQAAYAYVVRFGDPVAALEVVCGEIRDIESDGGHPTRESLRIRRQLQRWTREWQGAERVEYQPVS